MDGKNGSLLTSIRHSAVSQRPASDQVGVGRKKLERMVSRSRAGSAGQ